MRPRTWGVVAMMAFAPAAAGDGKNTSTDSKTIRVVLHLPTVDGESARLGLAEPLPAGRPFTLELSAPDRFVDQVTVVVAADDPRCRTATEADWGDCPQHYEIEMASAGGAFTATMPILQVDQRYRIWLKASTPMSTLLAGMPTRVAARVLAGAYATVNTGKARCNGAHAGPRDASGPYDPKDDIAAALAESINEIGALSLYKLQRTVQAADVEMLATKASRLVRFGRSRNQASGDAADESDASRIAPKVPTVASEAKQALDKTKSAAGTQAAASATRSEPTVSPPAPDLLATYIDRMRDVIVSTDNLNCALNDSDTQLSNLEAALRALQPPSVQRVFDAGSKLIMLTAIDATTSEETLQTVALQLEQLARDYGQGANRMVVDQYLATLNKLQIPSDRYAARSAWKALAPWPATHYVFVGPFGNQLAATSTQLGGHTVGIGDPFILRSQLEAYAAVEPNAHLAAVAAKAYAVDQTFIESVRAKLVAASGQATAAAIALEARVMEVMQDLENDPVLRVSTGGFSFTTTAGYGETPVAANFASPDFGIAFALPRALDGDHDLWMLPYFGLNLYAVPVDRAISLSNLAASNHPCWNYIGQHASLTVGLTLAKPSLAGLALKGPLLDRYPVLALGWRISHFIRGTGGVVFYAQPSANPNDSTTHILAAPFLGVSVDTDIIDIAKNGFSHL